MTYGQIIEGEKPGRLDTVSQRFTPRLQETEILTCMSEISGAQTTVVIWFSPRKCIALDIYT